MIINLIQLQSEIKKWLEDGDTRQILNSWIKSNVKILYGVSIIFGSSFSGIELCNSNLFQWYIFYMNLPRMYKRIFKHKRFVYNVRIIHNLPHLDSFYGCFLRIDFVFALVYTMFLIQHIDFILLFYLKMYHNW